MVVGTAAIRRRGKEDDGENTQLYVQIRHAGKGVSRRCVCEMVVNTRGLGFLTLI